MPAVAQISVDFASQNNITNRNSNGTIINENNLQSGTKAISPLTLSRYCLYSREKNGLGENFGAFDVSHLAYEGGFITAGDKINYKHSDLQIRGNLDLEKSVYVDSIYSRRKETSANNYQTNRASIERSVTISALDSESTSSFISIQSTSASKTTTLKTQHAAINNSIVLSSTSSGVNKISIESSNVDITGIVKSENNASTVWVKSLTGPGQLTTDNYNAINVRDFVKYTFTRGMIMMFSGTVTKGTDNVLVSPTGGWAVCDGTTATYNGVSTTTPDLRDKFIVGAGTNYALSDTGGSNTVTLTETQIPTHNHGTAVNSTVTQSIDISVSGGAHTHTWSEGATPITGIERTGGDAYSSGESGSFKSSGNTNIASSGSHSHSGSFNLYARGGGSSHENRPPYYALYYIIKL